ncbi:hypothetical protein Q1695_001108 [Nippostrongylus brasiliensis]|nr:hypothetical protein Q1695_001108 [Nippostrongylus brasiliensis]
MSYLPPANSFRWVTFESYPFDELLLLVQPLEELKAFGDYIKLNSNDLYSTTFQNVLLRTSIDFDVNFSSPPEDADLLPEKKAHGKKR